MNNRSLAMVRKRVKGREAKKASPAALAKQLYPELVKVMSPALKASGCRSLRALWQLSGLRKARDASFYDREVDLEKRGWRMIRPGVYEFVKSSEAARK